MVRKQRYDKVIIDRYRSYNDADKRVFLYSNNDVWDGDTFIESSMYESPDRLSYRVTLEERPEATYQRLKMGLAPSQPPDLVN